MMREFVWIVNVYGEQVIIPLRVIRPILPLVGWDLKSVREA